MNESNTFNEFRTQKKRFHSLSPSESETTHTAHTIARPKSGFNFIAVYKESRYIYK